MDLDIATLLAVDGITTGAVYVLLAIGMVLIFTVTRVIFVPFGDIAAFAALTLSALESKHAPGTAGFQITQELGLERKVHFADFVQEDGAVGGLGGCPFAGQPKAAGNICTEELVLLCEEMGIDTGVDLDNLIEVGRMAEDIVGHQLPSELIHAGSLDAFRRRVN